MPGANQTMKIMLLYSMLIMCSICRAGDAAPQCGDRTTIERAIADLAEDYGDVALALKCKNPRTDIERLICADEHLFSMYKLSTMAEVYARENATKAPLKHAAYKSALPKCADKRCLCKAFMESTNDSLGGESPYYADK